MRMQTLLVCASVLISQLAVADALPQRWVSAGGAFSEWVVALGGEGKRVGVDSTSQYPQSLKSLPGVGGNLQMAGKDTLTAWMIEQAGGISLGEHNGYTPVSHDAMLSLDPEVIIIADARLEGDAAHRALLEQMPILGQTRAGRDGRIVVIDPTLLVGGLGPRVPDALSRLATAFYPDVKAQTAEISQ